MSLTINGAKENDSEPGFDYNTRNEDLNKEPLLKRGYDKNGALFAPKVSPYLLHVIQRE